MFDIATGLRPASVRDQITRARLLIRRAWDKGIIEPGIHPIVISGGGAAGATCALEALKLGVPVVLVEKEPYLFGLQRLCTTRTMDPNLYDWPAGHWENTSYPISGDHVDLMFKTHERPRRIALRWAEHLRDAATHEPHLLDIRHAMTIRTVDPLNKLTHHVTFNTVIERELVPAPAGTEVEASMVVFAQGPGKERDSLPENALLFHGYRFWDTDPFTPNGTRAERRRTDGSPTAKRRPARVPQRVLIVGSGDGALQDFLRFILRPAAGLRTLLAECNIPAEYRTSIESSQEHNTAAFLWCDNREHEHDNDRYAHQRHVEVVTALFASWRTRRQILRAVKRSLRADIPEIVLMPGCDHFTHSYPANRFAALLVIKALQKLRKGRLTLRENTFLTSITCNHPVPADAIHLRKHCYADAHTITSAPGRCWKVPARSPDDPVEDFDTIILRVGINEKLSGVPFPRDHEKPLRQLLPIHLAHQS